MKFAEKRSNSLIHQWTESWMTYSEKMHGRRFYQKRDRIPNHLRTSINPASNDERATAVASVAATVMATRTSKETSRISK